MKKVIIILVAIVVIILAIFLGWYFLVRDPNIPLGEMIRKSLPFGSGGDAPTRPSDWDGQATDSQQPVTDEFGSPTAKLFRIADTPVAGAIALNRGTETVVRYVDRATGHIYDVTLPTETGSATLKKIKVTNNTLPKVYEAYFRSDGNAVLLRFLRDDSDIIENLAVTLTPPKSTTASTSSPQADSLYTASSIALRGDIDSIAVAESGNILFYVLRDPSSIISSSFNATNTKVLLASPFNNWRLNAIKGSLVLYTKASSNVSGSAYTLNTSGGALTKILGPLNGLVALLNTAGDQVLYSYVESGGTKLFTRNLTDKTLSELSPATLAEKCVWGTKNTNTLFCGVPVSAPGAGEPDLWYRGLTHFSDHIWSFDTSTSTDIAQVLAEPDQSLGINIDVMEPKLSPNENYLIFINKTDLSLWALRLEQS